jgi:hypothetical protein
MDNSNSQAFENNVNSSINDSIAFLKNKPSLNENNPKKSSKRFSFIDNQKKTTPSERKSSVRENTNSYGNLLKNLKSQNSSFNSNINSASVNRAMKRRINLDSSIDFDLLNDIQVKLTTPKENKISIILSKKINLSNGFKLKREIFERVFWSKEKMQKIRKYLLSIKTKINIKTRNDFENLDKLIETKDRFNLK